MGIGIISNGLITNLVDAPVLPPALHSAGWDQWDHRYVAERFDGNIGTAVGTAVPVWKDLIGSLNLNRVAGVGSIQTVTQDGIQAVRVASGVSGTEKLLASSPGRPGTIAAVLRVTDTTTTALRALGYEFKRVSSGNSLQVQGAVGVGGWTYIGAGTPATSWIFLLANLTDLTPLLRVNATEKSTADSGTVGAGTNTDLAVQSTAKSGASLSFDYAEFLVSDQVADSATRNAIHAAMKAKYPALP